MRRMFRVATGAKSRVFFLCQLILLNISVLNSSPVSASKLFENKSQQGNVQPIPQAIETTDVRVGYLEQQVRELTGKIEELNFMVLQMQEQIRNLQLAPSTRSALDAHQAQTNPPNTNPTSSINGQAPAGNDQKSERSPASIKFDSDGKPIDKSQQTTSLFGKSEQTVDFTQINNAKELYDLGYQRILAGDYRGAEEVFRDFQKRFDGDALNAEASYWLGEALYAQGRYRDAAEVYSEVQRRYKDWSRAPENLLKLGMTMAKLDNAKVACAVFTEIGKRYKTIEPALSKRVKEEQSRNHCH